MLTNNSSEFILIIKRVVIPRLNSALYKLTKIFPGLTVTVITDTAIAKKMAIAAIEVNRVMARARSDQAIRALDTRTSKEREDDLRSWGVKHADEQAKTALDKRLFAESCQNLVDNSINLSVTNASIKKKNAWLKNYWQITVVTYYKILVNQKYRCKICKSSESTLQKGSGKDFVIDHCKRIEREFGFKQIRGLLCYQCNNHVGLIETRLSNISNEAIYKTRPSFLEYSDERLESFKQYIKHCDDIYAEFVKKH